jgi:DNA-binding beta-propeller fold protein YncE
MGADMRRVLLASVAAVGLMATGEAAAAPIVDIHRIGTFDNGGETNAEISAYDPASKRLFVVNGGASLVDIIDLSDPTAPTKIGSIDTTGAGAGAGQPNSIAVKNGLVAVAIQNQDKTANGYVGFYDASGALQTSVAVGALPDMVTFTPDGTKVLVANEGEPNSYGQADSFDPVGSISVIDVANGFSTATAGFGAFVGQEAALKAAGVRIFGPGANAAQDFEPEYIAVSPDGAKAFVTLQENNAFAVLDLSNPAAPTVTDILPLGYKDHSLPGAGLDASDRDGPGNNPALNIASWPVKGMYQPDAVAAFTVGGQTYYATANEGDARDYVGFAEEVRVGAGSYPLDPAAFLDGTLKSSNDELNRLTVTNQLGDTDGDGDFDEIYVFGGRSFSLWNEQGDLVFDSGDQLEQLVASLLPPEAFNANNVEDELFDNRSDNKGPEPEGLAIAYYGESVLLFVALERVGGVMAFDITDPSHPVFLTYFNDRDFASPFDPLNPLGPEGLLYIAAVDSPNGRPLLIVTNEISGTIDILAVDIPAPAALGLLALGLAGAAGARHRRR